MFNCKVQNQVAIDAITSPLPENISWLRP